MLGVYNTCWMCEENAVQGCDLNVDKVGSMQAFRLECGRLADSIEQSHANVVACAGGDLVCVP